VRARRRARARAAPSPRRAAPRASLKAALRPSCSLLDRHTRSDPLGYIRSIQSQFAQFGIALIEPPPSWRPPADPIDELRLRHVTEAAVEPGGGSEEDGRAPLDGDDDDDDGDDDDDDDDDGTERGEPEPLAGAKARATPSAARALLGRVRSAAELRMRGRQVHDTALSKVPPSRKTLSARLQTIRRREPVALPPHAPFALSDAARAADAPSAAAAAAREAAGAGGSLLAPFSLSITPAYHLKYSLDDVRRLDAALREEAFPPHAADKQPHAADGAPHAADGAPHAADGARHAADGAPHAADGTPTGVPAAGSPPAAPSAGPHTHTHTHTHTAGWLGAQAGDGRTASADGADGDGGDGAAAPGAAETPQTSSAPGGGGSAASGARPPPAPSAASVEHFFWNVLGSRDEASILYWSDVAGSAFGRSGGLAGWDLQSLPGLSGSLLRHCAYNMPGVNDPMLYLGILFAMFAW
jgi:hypothetical protein